MCKKPGHEPGDMLCDEYVENNPNIQMFFGKDNVLSNFYPCQINIFGVTHKSAEHALQYVKSMRSGEVPRATAVQEAATALDAKKNRTTSGRISQLLGTSRNYHERDSGSQSCAGAGF